MGTGRIDRRKKRLIIDRSIDRERDEEGETYPCIVPQFLRIAIAGNR